jgi:hypothetical protein
MITGFNTDVKHADTVYHVQTEDKGRSNPVIESLVYVRGAILDSFRTGYRDFLDSGGFSEAFLQKILEFQHRHIVTSIKRGKYKKGMPLPDFVEGDFVFKFDSLQGPVKQAKSGTPSTTSSKQPPDPKASQPAAKREVRPRSSQSPVSPRELAKELAIPFPAPIINTGGELLSAVEASASVREEKGIEICVEGSKDFQGGEQVNLQLYVQNRENRARLEDVQVVIKIIGTTFSPRLYAGKTDKAGALKLNFSLPSFSGGSAALLIQASASSGHDEVKYLIKRKR